MNDRKNLTKKWGKKNGEFTEIRIPSSIQLHGVKKERSKGRTNKRDEILRGFPEIEKSGVGTVLGVKKKKDKMKMSSFR